MTATTTLSAPPVRRTAAGSLWATGPAAGLVASVATVGVAAFARAVDVRPESRSR
jgi:hypothetical protein